MRDKLRQINLPTVAVSVVLALVVTGGSATASKLITNHDIKKGTISLNRLTPKTQSLIKTHGADGQNGEAGLDGAAGAKGDAGTNGATGATGSAGSIGPIGPAGPDPETARVVNASNLRGFLLAPYGDNSTVDGRGPETDGDHGTITFSTPPIAPPLGTKSLEQTNATDRSVVTYLPNPAQGKKIDEVTDLTYATLVAARNPADAAGDADIAMQMEVLHSSSTYFANGYGTMIYEPRLNGFQGATTWQRHNVTKGVVWFSKPLPSGNCTMAVPCSFAQFQQENPNAVIQTIKMRTGQNSGGSWAGFDGYVDDITLGFGTAVEYDLGG